MLEIFSAIRNLQSESFKQLFYLGNARRRHCSYLVEARAPAAQNQQKSRAATKLPIQNFVRNYVEITVGIIKRSYTFGEIFFVENESRRI